MNNEQTNTEHEELDGKVPEMLEPLPSETVAPEAALSDAPPETAMPSDAAPVETETAPSETTAGHATEPQAIDYTSFTKKDFVKLAEDALAGQDAGKTEEVLRHAKPAFDEMKEAEKTLALEKFVAGGGERGDFEYKFDGLTQKFENLCRQLKERKAKTFHDQERTKEQNLQAKTALLERLRQLADGEESNASINEFKKIQQEWKAIGAVNQAQSQEMWANYNALVERFYSNRSIYFELKELDRKKNLALKQDICARAEKLATQEISPGLIRELTELHEEYKHIGPVPREEQETLWQRFKAASDVIYGKRKVQLDELRGQMEQHIAEKTQLCEQAEQYTAFQSDKIVEWNAKTKEVLELQKRWDAAGMLPREKAKEINKRFWAAFKLFFHRKNEFFRQLEAVRQANLRRKTELCEQVEAIAASDDLDMDAAAERIKELQAQWKETGPVSEKVRETVFERFKKACDAFFAQRRGQRNETEKEFEHNLAVKAGICQQIEDMAANKSADVAAFGLLRKQWDEAGFVPRRSMDAVRKRYADAVKAFLANTTGLSEPERAKAIAGSGPAKSAPQHTSREIPHNEHAMRRQITQLENDVALWRNNLEFFARSKNADALRNEFTAKIDSAEQELKALKQQMKMLNTI